MNIGLKLFAGLLAVLVFQPILVWNNPNLYLFAGVLVGLNQALETKRKGLQPRQFIGYGLALVLLAVGVLGPVISGFAIHDRHRIFGIPRMAERVEIPPLDESTAPVVPREVALASMNRMLSAQGLSERYKIGVPVKQLFNRRLVWAAPLEARGFLARVRSVPAPGYALVDANDIRAARLVPVDIEVSDEALFGLDSRVWFQHPSFDVFGWYFEVDNTGRPHWVGILAHRTVGFRGYEVAGAVTVDVTTGAQRVYARDEIPRWVNNKFPMELVIRQLNAAGDEAGGVFSFSDRSKFELSSPLSMVYFDDRAWYEGALSDLDDQLGIREVVMVNTEDKTVRRIWLPGLTDDQASAVLISHAPIQGLMTSTPVLFEVDGRPAYIASLYDSLGNIQAYGIVAQTDDRVFALGKTLHEARERFDDAVPSVEH
ncbi:TPA: hypothetical protein QDB04_000263 [Burkholderia vietnamiensis]|nr:hypothetical protein [Burkholderia vietnamiensis]